MSEINEQIINGQQTFLDLNGSPLAAGRVFFYVPGTTTPKTTWVDKDFVVANTNPIILDQAGRATIWGQGQYREIVQDQFGNVQWDQIVGQVPQNIDQNVNGTFTVNGSTVLNGGLQVNNANEPGGPSDIKGGLVVEAGSGQTVALEVLGAIESPPGTGGLNINNGLIVNADSGALDALKLNGDLELDGSDGGTTFGTGQRVRVSGSSDPGFVVENQGDALSYGMWETAHTLAFGVADGTAGGNIVNKLMTLNTSGNVTATSFNPTSDRDLKRNVRSLDINCLEIVGKVLAHRYKIGESDREYWGFMAQDLALATGDAIGADGTLSLMDLIAVLWKALQELSWKVGQLEGKIK